MSKKNTIRVLDCAGTTVARRSQRDAEEMIARGLARRRGSAVELIHFDYRVKRQILLSNGDGMATLEAIKHLPVAGDLTRLITGKRPDPETLRDFQDCVLSVRPIEPESPTAECPRFHGISLLSPSSAFAHLDYKSARRGAGLAA